MKPSFAFVLAIVLLLASCAAPTTEGIEVHDVWARPAAQGGNGAVYFSIQSSTADELVSVTSDVADAVEMHESRMSGDVMEMRQLESLPLGAGDQVTFEPGGLHIMLVGLKQDIKTEDEFEITLHFKHHEDLKVNVIVSDTPTSEQHHPPNNQGTSEIEQNKEKWQHAKISHYRFHLNIGCFCVFREDMPLIIEVKDGEVLSMEYQSGNEIDAESREIFKRYETIDLIFAELEAGLHGAADAVTVEYDPRYGFPTEAIIDVLKETVDDELHLTISNFEMLP